MSDVQSAPAQEVPQRRREVMVVLRGLLLAIMASMYAVYHGPEGLKKIARRVHQGAAVLAAGLKALGWTVAPKHFFILPSMPAISRPFLISCSWMGLIRSSFSMKNFSWTENLFGPAIFLRSC